MLSTPENIFSDSMTYLNIYIGGLIFLFLYNICTGIFTAMGDSKTPLYFLFMLSVGNIILDLVFVIVFNMGVAGVGWATFIAQGISSLLAFAVLLKRVHGIKSGTYKKFSIRMLGHISRIAIPSILQQSFVSVGNLFIQSRVNSFGSDVIAGYSAAIKLNTFAITSFFQRSEMQCQAIRHKTQVRESFSAYLKDLKQVLLCLSLFLCRFSLRISYSRIL